jgi:hypothetical protein
MLHWVSVTSETAVISDYPSLQDRQNLHDCCSLQLQVAGVSEISELCGITPRLPLIVVPLWSLSSLNSGVGKMLKKPTQDAEPAQVILFLSCHEKTSAS